MFKYIYTHIVPYFITYTLYIMKDIIEYKITYYDRDL